MFIFNTYGWTTNCYSCKDPFTNQPFCTNKLTLQKVLYRDNYSLNWRSSLKLELPGCDWPIPDNDFWIVSLANRQVSSLLSATCLHLFFYYYYKLNVTYIFRSLGNLTDFKCILKNNFSPNCLFTVIWPLIFLLQLLWVAYTTGRSFY